MGPLDADGRLSADGIEVRLAADDAPTSAVRLEVHGADGTRATIEGWASACRYLARLWRDHPVHATNAALLDASLELLQGAVLRPETLERALARLDARLEETAGVSPWIEGMERRSVVDTCWAAALRHAEREMEADIAWNDHPHLALWWLGVNDRAAAAAAAGSETEPEDDEDEDPEDDEEDPDEEDPS